MPLYRYRCDSCGSEFTILVRKRSEGDGIVCPDCGSNQTQRVVSRVAIQFKGSGYYKTDYARRGKSQLGKKSNGSNQSEDSANQEESPSSSKAESSKAGRKSQPSKPANKESQSDAKANSAKK